MITRCYLFVAIGYLLIIVFTFSSIGITSPEKLNYVLSLIEDGLYPQAINQLEDLSISVDDQEITPEKSFLLASCYRKLRMEEKAIFYYQEAIREKSSFSDYALYHMGECYFELKEYQKALEGFKELTTKYPQTFLKSKALYRIAQNSFMLEDYLSAIKEYQEFIRWFPADEKKLKTLYQIALSYQNLGNWQEAFLRYQEIIRQDPKHRMALESLKKIEEILAAYPIELKADEYLAQAKGWYYHQKYEKAYLICQKVIEIEKDNLLLIKALSLLGDSFYEERNFLAAIGAYQKALSISSNEGAASSYYKLALAYLKTDKEKEAERMLKKFAFNYPKNSYAVKMLHLLANRYYEKEKHQQAIKIYQHIYKKYPKNDLAEQAIWMSGWCYLKLKDYRKSIIIFKYLIKEYPQSSYLTQAYFWVGKCYQRLNKPKKASLNYCQVVSKDNYYYQYLAKDSLRRLRGSFGKEKETLRVDNASWEKIKNINLGRAQDLMELRIFDDAILELKDMEKVKVKDVNLLAGTYYKLITIYNKTSEYKKSWFYATKIAKILKSSQKNISLPEELHQMLYPLNYYEFVTKYANEYNLDPYLALAVAREESNYDPNAVSVANACGLMQIIPSTGRAIAKRIEINFSKESLFNPEVNIKMGCYYLKELIDKFKKDEVLVLAAYNGGPNKVNSWVKKYGLSDIDEFVESIPYYETKQYVKKVLSSYQRYKEIYLK
ncbi:tetratricopeptide repeat protein [bacterium]|nr:tetratricopeptide repeat protein [bacterium]MBU1153141.1 tetratricopeptide repeat protein [bacterium]